MSFINALYPFLVEHDEITTDSFRQKVKFKFASKFEIETDNALNLIQAKFKHLNFLQQEIRYKKIAEQISNKLLQSKIDNFQKMLIDDVCSDVHTFLVKQIKSHVMMMIHMLMLMIQMMMIWILTGFLKCLNMALSNS